MSVSVVQSAAEERVTLEQIPLRSPGQLMELDFLLEQPSCAVPVQAALAEDVVTLRLGDGALVIRLDPLELHRAVAVGKAQASMSDPQAAAAFLERFAEEVGRQVPAPRDGQAPRLECEVQISAHRPAEAEIAMKLSFPFGSLWALLETESAVGSLIVSEEELADWDSFAAGFVEQFRDGRPLRKKAAEESALELDAPLIPELRSLEGAEGVGLHDLAIGADRIFAPRKTADATTLLCWRAPSFVLEEICQLPAPRCQIYPAPRGPWAVVETTVPGMDGSLTDGDARRVLLNADRAAGAPDPLLDLCEKTPLFSFGDTSQSVKWSADGRRFAMMGGQAELDGSETNLVIVYDVERQEPVDEIAHYLARRWDGDRLILSRLEEDGWTLHAWTPGCSDSPRPCDGDDVRRVGEYRLTEVEAGLQVVSRDGAVRTFEDSVQGFRMPWAGRYAIEPGGDPRVLDLRSFSWRYLTPEGSAAGPWDAAADGGLVLFADLQFGYAVDLVDEIPPKISWREPAPGGMAIAFGRLAEFEAARETAAGDANQSAVIDALERRLDAHRKYAEGRRSSEEQRFSDAARSYVGAAELEPEWDAARQLAVATFRRAQDAAGMVAAAAAWCTMRPEAAEAHLQLSIARQMSDDLPGALAAVERALGLSADRASIHYQHGCVLALSGSREPALAAIDRATELESGIIREIAEDDDLRSLRGQPGFRCYDALRLLGEANQLYREGKLQAAMPKLIQSADFDPSNEAAFRGLALCSSDLEDSQAFSEATEAWVEAHPDSLRAWLFRFDAFLQQQDGVAALDAAERIQSLDPDGAAAHLSAARARAISGDDSGALEALRRLLALRPDLVEAIEQYPELAPLRVAIAT